MTCQIYVIGREEGPVKVGISKNVDADQAIEGVETTIQIDEHFRSLGR